MSDVKILYVDDEDLNLQLFKINLADDYFVITAENGEKGLEILDMNPDIKVVVSDMKMPRMNGIEFIKIAKTKHPDIRFYILTGYDINEKIRDALNEGLIIKYFRKPFKIEEIKNEIARVISG